jgi:hypothetical protein
MRFIFATLSLAFMTLALPAAAEPRSVFDTRGQIRPDHRYLPTDDVRGWRYEAGSAAKGRSVRRGPDAGARGMDAQTDNDGRVITPTAGAPVRMTRGGIVAAVTAPVRFIAGRLVCARNVNALLESRGIRGTGSDWAKSFLDWGRPSGPVPGAVAVFHRKGGGHVAIVHSVEPDGTVIYLNPSNSRQAWQVGPYHKRAIGYRVPS